MNFYLKQAQLLVLVILLLVNSACAMSDCVFDRNMFSKDRYKDNPNVSKFVWVDSTKEAKGITDNGALFSVKHWSCDHYGTHAVMFLGPYFSGNIENIDKLIMALANIALQKDEIAVVERYIRKKPIAISSNSEKININTKEYSEFYVAYSIVDEVIILEIKLYKD